jgi:hypothetical protein
MDNKVLGIILIIFISTIASWFFCRSKKAETPVKVMIFILYFWLFVFIQLIFFAVLYQFGVLDVKG